MSRYAWIAALALAGGCGGDDGPKSARGETPIRMVICAVGDQNCFVSARFKDFSGCESHKRWAEMLCDSRSDPNVMICKRDTGQQISVAYCTA